MNCSGNCRQGRAECDCSGDAPEMVVTLFCAIGAVVIVGLIVLGVL